MAENEKMKVYSATIGGQELVPNIQETTGTITWGDADSATDAHSFLNNGRVILKVETSTGNGQQMNIVTPLTVGGLPVGDRQYDLAASQTKLYGPFPPNIYNNDDGYVSVWVNSNAAAAIEITPIRLS